MLPLLELGLGNCPAATQTGAFHCLARPHLRAAQQRWEAAHGGAMQLHLPPADSSNSSTGNSGVSASLRLSLLEDPPGASCPYCPGQAASLADYQRGWPPESAAELLAALGQDGLGRLQFLDVAATTHCGELAEVIAASCRQGAWAALQHCEDLLLPPGGCGLLDSCIPERACGSLAGCSREKCARAQGASPPSWLPPPRSSLQRLRLAGCRALMDEALVRMLSSLPCLQDLDVSGERPTGKQDKSRVVGRRHGRGQSSS